MSRLLIIAVCLLALTSFSLADDAAKPQADVPKFELRDGDRVVFLGNTLIERAQKYGYWETMLTARYPDRDITFRNLGWSGDTVWAESRGIFDPPAVGYQRMIEHVGRLKPTVIFLGYGNNEAFAGKEGLPAFIKQYNKLLDDLTGVSAEGVRFVLLSPHRFEHFPAPLPHPRTTNKNVTGYAAVLRNIAKERETIYIDLYSTLIAAASEEQQPTRSLLGDMTQNGIHLSDAGYQRAGRLLIEQLFEIEWFDFFPWELGLDAKGKVRFSDGSTVRKLKLQNGNISFEVLDERLPSLVSPRRLEVLDLQHAPYALRIDGKEIMQRIGSPPKKAADQGTWCDVWSVGQSVETGQEFAQLERLRRAIIEKNRLYFYRWRPQNITYLFGFRKHEQGQNAKELAEFDKLIAAKEAEINKLKKPVPHTYEIIRVKDKPAEKQNDKQSQKQ